jgi:predicted ester cyclase
MPAEQNANIARRFFAEQDRLRGGPAPELCAPNYTAHLPGYPPLDFTGHQSFAAAFYAGFPDVRHNLEHVVTESDRAAVRFILLGTHSGPFMGMPATGTSITISATVLMRFEDGRVAELWGEFDRLGLMTQLMAGVNAVEQPHGI